MAEPQSDAGRSLIEGQAMGASIANSGGDMIMVRSRYEAFEGPLSQGAYLRLGVNLSGTVSLMQRIGDSRLEGSWRRGGLAVTPPFAEGEGRCGSVSMLGLALRWDRLEALVGRSRAEHLPLAAEQIHHDAYLSAVLEALWHEADLHGASTAFFEQGARAVLQRLEALMGVEAPMLRTPPLGRPEMARVVAYVDDRLAMDISVADLAAVVGREVSGFARAFKTRTGETPFTWLTRRRMTRAMQQLRGGVSVADAAAEVGYANASKFAAAFRRMTGSSPTQWLNNTTDD